VNFGPNILALLENPREALQAAQSLWAKVQKQKSYGGRILTIIPIFSKLVSFGPHILALLESAREGPQAAQSLWAKVQKQKSYGGSNSEVNSDFLKIGELWSTYFDVVGKP